MLHVIKRGDRAVAYFVDPEEAALYTNQRSKAGVWLTVSEIDAVAMYDVISGLYKDEIEEIP